MCRVPRFAGPLTRLRCGEEVGLSGGTLRVVPMTSELRAQVEFVAGGPHVLTLSAYAAQPVIVRLALAVDGMEVGHVSLELSSRTPSEARFSFTLKSAGHHELLLRRVLDPEGVPSMPLLKDMRLTAGRAPCKYAMPDGVAILVIDPVRGEYRTFAVESSASEDMATQAWASALAWVRRASTGATLLLLRPRSAIVKGESLAASLLEGIGAGATDVARFASGEVQMVAGSVGAIPGTARVWRQLPVDAGLFFEKGSRVTSEAQPLPCPLGVGNPDHDYRFRSPPDVGFHVPKAYVSGAFYLPAGMVDGGGGDGLKVSFLERSVQPDARMWRLFLGVQDDPAKRLSEYLTKSPTADQGISLSQWRGGQEGRRFGWPIRSVSVAGARWHTLLQAPVRAIEASGKLHLALLIDQPQRVTGLQVLLHTRDPQRLLWCEVPSVDAIGFEKTLGAFNVEGAHVSEVTAAELRVETLEGSPVDVEVYQLTIDGR